MIYLNKYLQIKLLLENVCKYDLTGIYRPQAYVAGGKSYCTECQIDLFKTIIEPGKSAVVKAVLYAPHGYGEHLKVGALVTLKNGLDIEAKGIVLEIHE